MNSGSFKNVIYQLFALYWITHKDWHGIKHNQTKPSEFKPVTFCLKTDHVSQPAHKYTLEGRRLQQLKFCESIYRGQTFPN